MEKKMTYIRRLKLKTTPERRAAFRAVCERLNLLDKQRSSIQISLLDDIEASLEYIKLVEKEKDDIQAENLMLKEECAAWRGKYESEELL